MEHPGNLGVSGETFIVGVESPRRKGGANLSSHVTYF